MIRGRVVSRGLLLGAVLAVCAAAGCREDAPSRVAGVLSFTGSSPVNAVVEREMLRTAAERGVGLVWLDEDDYEPDIPREEAARRAFDRLLLEEGAAALILRQARPGLDIDLMLQAARERGAPVVFLDSLPEGLGADAYVAADYRSAGREAAQFALERAKERRRRRGAGDRPLNAAVVEGILTNENDRLAAAGFYDVLDRDPGVKIVARASFASPPDAFAYVSGELQKYADNIQAVLAANAALAANASFAAQARGAAGSIETAGVGSSLETSRRIYRREHDLDIDTMPAAAGALALDVALGFALGDPPPADAVTRRGALSTATYYAPRRRITFENISETFVIWPDLAEE